MEAVLTGVSSVGVCVVVASTEEVRLAYNRGARRRNLPGKGAGSCQARELEAAKQGARSWKLPGGGAKR